MRGAVEPGLAWMINAHADADAAKHTAHTAVSTSLMCRKSGVVQNSRGVERHAIANVNGCRTANDPAAITANVAADNAGVQ